MADDVRRLQEENKALRARIHLLEQKIDLLVRQIYGPKSEKLDPDQLQLLFDPDGSKKDDAPAATDIEQLLTGAEIKPGNATHQLKLSRVFPRTCRWLKK